MLAWVGASRVERGKLDGQQRGEELARIAGVTTIDDLVDRDLVIEAATGDRDTKREVFRRLHTIIRPEVVLASNTTSIPSSTWPPGPGDLNRWWGCISSTRCR